jgi:hypothetical protein
VGLIGFAVLHDLPTPSMLRVSTNSLAKTMPNGGAREDRNARRYSESHDQPLLPMARLNV